MPVNIDYTDTDISSSHTSAPVSELAEVHTSPDSSRSSTPSTRPANIETSRRKRRVPRDGEQNQWGRSGPGRAIRLSRPAPQYVTDVDDQSVVHPNSDIAPAHGVTAPEHGPGRGNVGRRSLGGRSGHHVSSAGRGQGSPASSDPDDPSYQPESE